MFLNKKHSRIKNIKTCFTEKLFLKHLKTFLQPWFFVVCLCAGISQKSLELSRFLMHVDCGRGSILLSRRYNIDLRYVLPVLWMTLSFHILGPMARHMYS